jgi:hypothetical protein
MNYNDIIAQQQAMLNQVMERYQYIQYGLLAFSIAWLIIGAFVIYMFYARLRDIGDELRKFRIAYEFAHIPESRSQPRRDHNSESACPAPPKPLAPSPEDAKYLPKSK